MGRIRRPSPAMGVALLALFISLGGTAGAVSQVIVPHAKLADLAKVANDARKLNGKTSTQLVNEAATAPGPASSASGLLSYKTAAITVAAGQAADFSIACDAGTKVVSGGYSYQGSGLLLALDTYPANDTTWTIFLANGSASNPVNATLHAVCMT